MADWSALPLPTIADLLSMVGLAVLVVVVVVVLPAALLFGAAGWCADNAGDNGVKAAI